MKALFFVGLGGALGSIARYLIAVLMGKIFTSPFPFGTFTVNIIGCFLIGMFVATAAKESWLNQIWNLFLITGFCGGFTTFSSFSNDSIRLLTEGRYFHFGIYIGLSLILGLLATFLGFSLLRPGL